MKNAKKRVQSVARNVENILHDAYLGACDEVGKALHPAHELGLPSWACDMLAEAYEARLVED